MPRKKKVEIEEEHEIVEVPMSEGEDNEFPPMNKEGNETPREEASDNELPPSPRLPSTEPKTRKKRVLTEEQKKKNLENLQLAREVKKKLALKKAEFNKMKEELEFTRMKKKELEKREYLYKRDKGLIPKDEGMELEIGDEEQYKTKMPTAEDWKKTKDLKNLEKINRATKPVKPNKKDLKIKELEEKLFTVMRETLDVSKKDKASDVPTKKENEPKDKKTTMDIFEAKPKDIPASQTSSVSQPIPIPARVGDRRGFGTGNLINMF